MTVSVWLSVFQKRNHRNRRQLFATVQELQLDQELRCQEDSTHFLDEGGGRSGSPACREKIVDQDNSLPGLNGVECNSISASPYSREYFALSVL